MPFWGSWVISFFVKAVTQYLADKRAEQNLRDLGAATQANAAHVEAERQEAVAKTAGDAASDEPDDPRDLRRD